jgi:hypothetical protein
LALRIYLLGFILFLVSLVAPAYSPFGAPDYSGWEAIKAVLGLRPRLLLDFGRPGDILAALVLAVSGLNSAFALLSPLFFPQRRRFNRSPWFWAWVAAGMASMVFNLLYLNHTGIIHIRYGYYLWMAAIALLYLAFSPRLSGH